MRSSSSRRRPAAASVLLAMLAAGLATVASPLAPTAQAADSAEFVISTNSGVFTRTLDAVWHDTGFLAVWSEHPDHSVSGGLEVHSGNDAIRAQFVNLDGTPNGGDFQVASGGGSKDFPAVAHVEDTLSGNQQESLVVWADDRDGGDDIWSQRIAPSGVVLAGSNTKISGAGGDLFPDIAYGPTSSGQGNFLAVWENETASGESEVFGRVLQGAGGTIGSPSGASFNISEATGGRATAPSVAYDPLNDQFLVVWGDDRGGPSAERDIWGQYVNPNGTLAGTNLQIGSSSDLDRAPQVVFHPAALEYMVAWSHEPASGRETRMQRVTAGGGTAGPVIVAVTGTPSGAGQMAVDAATGNYMIPLNTGGALDTIEMQRIGVDGTVLARTSVSTDTAARKGPSVAVYGSTPVGPGAGTAAVSETLVVWRDGRNGGAFETEIFGRFVDLETDTDGDGLLDDWETNGWVDNDGDGVLGAGDFDFSTLPAANQPDVNHKDLYVEVDWMVVDNNSDGDATDIGEHSHAMAAAAPGSTPTGTPVDPVIAAFASAPVTNPDGVNGINLHVDVGQMGGGGPIPETVAIDFDSGFETVKQANFNAARQRVFRYAIRKHEGSGRGEIWGNDFWWNYSTALTQATGFMHELGHTIGLRHGGGDNINCKPNYFSIMSYAYQLTGITPGGTVDFSREQLGALLENNLDETQPLGDPNGYQAIFSSGGSVIGPNANTAGNVAINWDQDGTLDETGVSVDLNVFDQCNGNPAAASPGQTMAGWDDWDNVRYNFLSSPHFVDGIHSTIAQDADRTASLNYWRVFYGPPVVTDSFTGTTSALPGDALDYTLTLANGAAAGPARDLAATITVPAGITVTSTTPTADSIDTSGEPTVLEFAIDDLAAGEAMDIDVSGTVDHPPVADELTVASSTVVRNVLGEFVERVDSDFTTTILYPELEVTKVVTTETAPGEAITQQITVANVGTATAADVELTDTLAEGLVYSAALDTAAGPQPDSVTSGAGGTTDLAWPLGDLAAGDDVTIEIVIRSNLLVDPDALLGDSAVADFADANDNPYSSDPGLGSTTLTVVLDPDGPQDDSWWKVHPEEATDGFRAAVQVTDARYDGVDGSTPDGVLSRAEVEAALRPTQSLAGYVAIELLAVYLNLADQRLVSTAPLDGREADQLGVATVREAVWKAWDLMADPSTSSDDLSTMARLLDRVNKGKA